MKRIRTVFGEELVKSRRFREQYARFREQPSGGAISGIMGIGFRVNTQSGAEFREGMRVCARSRPGGISGIMGIGFRVNAQSGAAGGELVEPGFGNDCTFCESPSGRDFGNYGNRLQSE